MADGKKIEILLGATGGGESAAEIAKPKQAIDALITSEEQLAEKRAQFMTAAEAEVAEIDRLVVAANKLKEAKATALIPALDKLDEANNKVTKSSFNMGMAFRNMDYQVQDMAVQIGSGTSVIRAMGQQLPQLASGFGPVGITIGTVAAIALPLINILSGVGDSAAEAGTKVKTAGEIAAEVTEKLKKLHEIRQARVAAAGAEENKQWIKSLGDEYEAIKLSNDELQRSIDLLRAKRRGQIEIESAQAALDIAKIDADKNLTDAQKITARAGVMNDLEKKKFNARREDAMDDADKGDREAGVVRNEAQFKYGEAVKVSEMLEKQQAALAELVKKIDFGADQAKAQLPLTEDRLKKAIENFASESASGEGASSELLIKYQKEIDDAKAEKARLEAAANGGSDEDRGKLKDLRGDLNKETGRYDKNGSIVENQNLLNAKLEEAEKARKTAEAAEKKAADNRRLMEQTVEQDREVTTRRLGTTAITSKSAAEKADEKDAEEKAAAAHKKIVEDKQEADKAREREIHQKQEKLDDAAKEAARRIFEAVPPETPAHKRLGQESQKNKQAKGQAKTKSSPYPSADNYHTARDVASALENGASQQEIEKLTREVKEKAATIGAPMTKALLDVLRSLDKQASEIEKLKQERTTDKDGPKIPEREKGIIDKVGGYTREAPRTKVTEDVEKATERLKDGATADEYSGLGKALEIFVDSVHGLKQAEQTDLKNLIKTVQGLAERLRRVEGK